eukprot:COSAG02_NODE_6868_length_3316_cov_12.361517_4_plen_114_part_00
MGCGMILPLVAAAIVVTLAEGPCDILDAAGNPCVAAHRCAPIHRHSSRLPRDRRCHSPILYCASALPLIDSICQLLRLLIVAVEPQPPHSDSNCVRAAQHGRFLQNTMVHCTT